MEYVVCNYRALQSERGAFEIHNAAVGVDNVQNVTMRVNRSSSTEEKLTGERSEN